MTRFNRDSAQQLADNIATFGTAITEKVSFQLRFEALNALNRPEFDPSSLSVTSSAFGKITTQPNLPRSIQMAARLVW